ncbi:hypothetical protein OIU79_017456 [Salix purpurea]|uniref:Uncharacterized protein n=1 Tax=Salix purpurea TaxID=77065 RepID=A0A9Q0WVW2_SALPP|nr:hypothetical protein OIU79_017456 [Salix purpurea]
MFKKARPRGMRCGLEIGGAIFYFINSQREPAVHFIFTHTTALRKLFPCPSQASSFFSDRKSTGTKVGASIAFADKKSTPPIILELQAKNKSPSADQAAGKPDPVEWCAFTGCSIHKKEGKIRGALERGGVLLFIN